MIAPFSVKRGDRFKKKKKKAREGGCERGKSCWSKLIHGSLMPGSLWTHPDMLEKGNTGRSHKILIFKKRSHLIDIWLYILTGCSWNFRTCHDQIRLLCISITSQIHHFFVLGALKTLSTSYFETSTELLSTTAILTAAAHPKLLLLLSNSH